MAERCIEPHDVVEERIGVCASERRALARDDGFEAVAAKALTCGNGSLSTTSARKTGEVCGEVYGIAYLVPHQATFARLMAVQFPSELF